MRTLLSRCEQIESEVTWNIHSVYFYRPANDGSLSLIGITLNCEETSCNHTCKRSEYCRIWWASAQSTKTTPSKRFWSFASTAWPYEGELTCKIPASHHAWYGITSQFSGVIGKSLSVTFHPSLRDNRVLDCPFRSRPNQINSLSIRLCMPKFHEMLGYNGIVQLLYNTRGRDQ